MVISLGALLTSMDKSHAKTFLSTKTGNSNIHDQFLDSDKDNIKFEIFKKNRHTWQKSIGP